jgi:hypothetical protein
MRRTTNTLHAHLRLRHFSPLHGSALSAPAHHIMSPLGGTKEDTPISSTIRYQCSAASVGASNFRDTHTVISCLLPEKPAVLTSSAHAAASAPLEPPPQLIIYSQLPPRPCATDIGPGGCMQDAINTIRPTHSSSVQQRTKMPSATRSRSHPL